MWAAHHRFRLFIKSGVLLFFLLGLVYYGIERSLLSNWMLRYLQSQHYVIADNTTQLPKKNALWRKYSEHLPIGSVSWLAYQDAYMMRLIQAPSAQESADKHVEANLALLPSDLKLSNNALVEKEIARALRQEAINKELPPQIIVVLGGGLAQDATHHVTVNAYSRLRLQTALALQKTTHLPIMLSGRESNYMQSWLFAHNSAAVFMENHSTNTCQNARFTAQLLADYGGASRIFVVSDQYHLPRVKKQFAKQGIEVVGIAAPLPEYAAHKLSIKNELNALRRAVYEVLANVRDNYLETCP